MPEPVFTRPNSDGTTLEFWVYYQGRLGMSPTNVFLTLPALRRPIFRLVVSPFPYTLPEE